MPSLPTRLRAAWIAFREPEIVDAVMDMEQQAFETGVLVGRAFGSQRGFAIALPSERYMAMCGRATEKGLLS